MVAEAGAEKSCYSVNHGAGRAMGRKAAIRRARSEGDRPGASRTCDILTNCRQYPKDEAPGGVQGFRRRCCGP